VEALTYARVHEHLGKLKLERVAAVLDRVAEDAAKGEVPYVEFLDKLLERGGGHLILIRSRADD